MDTPPAPIDPISSESTLIFKRSHLYSVLLPLAFVTGLAVGYLFWGRTPAAPSGAAAAAAQSQNQAAAEQTGQDQSAAADPNANIKRYDVPVDDDPALGPADAPITMIEFSDYECPYCRKWQQEVFQKLVSTYGDKVRFVYRDFPLSSIHANAAPAALAADCAGEQGAYWGFHDKLFGMEQGLSTDAYKLYAAELNLDQTAFAACLDSGKYNNEVQADYQFAANLGVRSTPTFFINGIAVVGAQPFEVFQQVIEKELAGEIPK